MCTAAATAAAAASAASAAVTEVTAHSRKISWSCAKSHYYIHTYCTTEDRLTLAGRKTATSLNLYIYFGKDERYISFRTFTTLNFSFQHSVRLNSKSYFSCGLHTLHLHSSTHTVHAACTDSFFFLSRSSSTFNCFVFVINEQENWST